MHTITFTCETITPMFLSGADGTTPELRAPSIKGALRFWWRAMNGDDPNMKTEEAKLFGGSGDEEGKSKFTIEVLKPLPQTSRNEFVNSKMVNGKTVSLMAKTYQDENRERNGRKVPFYKINILKYLAFGPVQYDNVAREPRLTRDYIEVNETFKIKIAYSETIQNAVLLAFTALSNFGGLGSKSRNGFGCFRIVSATQKTVSINSDCTITEQEINVNLPTITLSNLANGNLANYTAFSSAISLWTSERQHSSWEEALFEVGDRYQAAREQVEYWHNWEKRQLIALPIIVRDERSQDDNFLERHAKPYFLHVEKLPNNRFRGSILCLPYNYLAEHPKFDGRYNEDYIQAIEDFNQELGLQPLQR